MKKLYIIILAPIFFIPVITQAQCTNTVIDWDYRDFFGQENATVTSFITLARSQNQAFAFGANKLTITHNYAGSTGQGENTVHTGSAGSNGTSGAGADVQFMGNGIITFTFRYPVENLRFSIFDIDRSQRIQFGAANGAVPVNIGLTTVSGAVLTIANNNTPTAQVTASATTVANTSSAGTINVNIAGPVTTVTMTTTLTATCTSSCGTGGNEDRSFWLSDIYGCTVSSFPNNYYAVSRPFTGMPGYVLTVRNNVFYYVDPLTGKAKYLFTDFGHTNINSMSYDPYQRLVYYTYSLSGSSGGTNRNEKSLRRYHYDMDTLGVMVPNVNTIGIPTYENGVETAAAGFYDGHLYLGIEGGSNFTESNIWRIELNAAHFPVAVSQVYAQPPYISGQRTQDWSDFGINNGVLYDFDAGAAGVGTNKDFYNQNLYTGVVTRYLPAGSLIPRQVSVDWAGQVYNVGSPSSIAAGTIAPYNLTNNVGTAQTMTYDGVTVVGSWGDAGEAFRPFCDFGDAPDSYDPDPWSPAVHERDTSLRLGPTFDREWLKTSSIDATADGSDEDGIGTVPIFDPTDNTYTTQVSVYNNTDTVATVIGWLDYNGNGLFDASEASAAVTIPANAGSQNIYLNWTGISSSLPINTYTYLRIRLVSSRYTMNAAHATGYYDGGETEDYRVVIDNRILPTTLISFEAKAINNVKVKLDWTASEDISFSGYEVQRSANGINWEILGFVQALQKGGTQRYEWLDNNPYKGSSRYRLKLVEDANIYKYSDIRTVRIIDQSVSVGLGLFPNPAVNRATVTITTERANQLAHIRIINAQGKRLSYQKLALLRGSNSIVLPLQASWPAGVYFVQVSTKEGIVNKKLVLRR
ncbi:MAG: T9SS type A sorting domain-containing protein [Chitinophagaceae bacterium]